MKIEKWYRLRGRLAVSGVLLWIIETIFFLFYYGWHWSAIGIEVYFDIAVIYLFALSALCWLIAVNKMVEERIKENHS